MRNLFTEPERLPLVAPSILSADFGHMARECAGVLSGGADLLHLDVMDGHFVPNLTMGPDMCKGVRRAFPDAFLDVHLMVTDPGMYFEAFAKAGANHVTFHVEVCSAAEGRDLAQRAHDLGMSAGLAINPGTDPGQALEMAEAFDLILVMSVMPGFSGQAFKEETLETTRAMRARVGDSTRVEMDGGIGPETSGRAIEAGCDVLVAASAIFGEAEGARSKAIEAIRAGG